MPGSITLGIVAVIFFVVSLAFSVWVERKHGIRDWGGEILAIVLVLLWCAFMLGVWLGDYNHS